ncbi:hypothetical protein Vafri_5983 [Volvox africanus]|nr:hypothetical protein Vafri_5983 [Volvox africanus]
MHELIHYSFLFQDLYTNIAMNVSMARLTSSVLWLGILIWGLATTSWVPAAKGDGFFFDVETTEPVEALNQRFPYRSCSENPSPYRLTPREITATQPEMLFCYDLNVNSNVCDTGQCCDTELQTIEFEVNSKCNAKGATVEATITTNASTTTSRPSIQAYKMNDGTLKYVLRLTNLNLGLWSDNTQICLNLTDGCKTVQDLCVPPTASSVYGTCLAAFFNDNESTGSCCSTDTVNPPYYILIDHFPCEQCMSITLQQTFFFPFDTFTTDICLKVMEYMADNLNKIAEDLDLEMSSKFSVDLKGCLPTSITVCGIFNEITLMLDNEALESSILGVATGTLSGVASQMCSLDSHTQPIATSLENNCVEFQATTSSCTTDPTAFLPTCPCDQSKGASPYYAIPFGSTEPGRRAGSTLYCFTIGVLPQEHIIPGECSNADTVEKIEVYADEAFRRNISGIRIAPNGEPPRWISPTWAAPGSNRMKVTPLRWNSSMANGGSFCFELNIPLNNFCGLEGCHVSLFDPTRSCCPTYKVTLPIDPDALFLS